MKAKLEKSVSDFLSRPVPHHINGQPWLTQAAGVLNPADGSVLAQVAMADEAEIQQAVRAAEKAFPPWANLRANERALLLHRFADALERHAAELAQIESLDVGKAITAAESFDIPFGIAALRYFADLSLQAPANVPLALKNMEARTFRAAYGVCVFVFPWNFPFTLLLWGISPALAAGNTVVVKPSEVTPLTSVRAAQIATEAGLPDGVLNVVTCDGANAGTALVSHPAVKRVSFTGSPEVGRKIGEICGRNLVPCKLELGGKGAAVVFDDVDIDETARKLAGAITLNTGQVCCTATRWMIHERIFERFVERAIEELKRVKIGTGLDRETEMGPLVSEVQRQRVLGYWERAQRDGATVLLEGGPLSSRDQPAGFFVKPALLTGSEENICYREEVFGPCAYLIRFKDEEAVVNQVNQLTYGLANSIWSSDIKRANRLAEHLVAGNCWINAHNVFAYGLPYGGVNLSGLGGGVNSPETFNDYRRSQTIARLLT